MSTVKFPDLGLPELPVNVDPAIEPDLRAVYMAIRNLAMIVQSIATGSGTTPIPLSYLDIDGTMTANSDTKVPSQKAVRTYVAAHSGSGSGDVVGPASSINNHVAFFSGTTGKLLADSGLTLSGTNTGDQNLSSYAPLASPALTGSPTAPTQTAGDSSTKLATTAYADAAAAAVAGSGGSSDYIGVGVFS